MANDKFWRIVLGLKAKTEAGELAWERTAVDNMYQVAFPHYLIQIRPEDSRMDPEGIDYVVRILNSDGETIDEMSDVDLTEGGSSGAFVTLRDTYYGARRIANGVEKALDDLLAQLGEK